MIDRDTIIRMAREADATGYGDELTGDAIERFAALVAAAEREACAKVCDTWPLSAKNMVRMESWKGGKGNAVAGSIYECAAAIRARGETSSRGQA